MTSLDASSGSCPRFSTRVTVAASVAAFSFLSPIFGVGLGWALLGQAMRGISLLGIVTVLALVTRVLEGPRIRQQAIARSFVNRFRAMELERDRDLTWRGWIDRFSELMRWDVDLAAAGETGLYDSLQALYSDMHREFARFMRTEYPAWLRNLEGDRPPLSIDIVSEFLLPIHHSIMVSYKAYRQWLPQGIRQEDAHDWKASPLTDEEKITALSAIREVHSHSQALMQCSSWLKEHLPNIRTSTDFDTATAAQALAQKGASLLPGGVITAEGDFRRGDMVEVSLRDGDGERRIARGIVQYSAVDIRRIAQRHSRDIEGILGYSYGENIVHRDDLALL